MQSDSSSLESLKNSLLSAVDADHNVTNPEMVLEIISQLEKIQISKDELQSTRLGREINTIRQKIDARKKSAKQAGDNSPSIIEIAQRAKKLLRSWQGLLNTPQTDSNISSLSIPQQSTPIARSVSTPTTNGEIHESKSPPSEKPRLIVKVKINSSISTNSNNDTMTQIKRKNDSETNGLSTKRRKAQIETPVSSPSPLSPIGLIESTASLPRLKTTQQLLMEMQMNQPDVLSTQTPTVNAILQNQIIDESLNDKGKVDYSALHHGRDSNNSNVNANYQKQLTFSTLPNVISPSNSTGSSSKRSGLVRRPSSTLLAPNNNWENGSSAGDSPVSPSSTSSSSITSSTSWPISTNIPEPPSSMPVIPKKKRRRKETKTPPPSSQQQQQIESFNIEQSTPLSPDLATMCSSYNSVAELVDAHRQRVLAEHDARELEARPNLLLVPIEQLAFVYERERTKELKVPYESKTKSLTTVDKLDQPSGLIALPFIDCPLDFDLVLDELVVQQPTMGI
ncbi:unnamed protein product [Rotaria socialis]|uniref:TFIIS N-terminal domain-containing protein n=1 Tax=Rotaria socialis TaxID=392032 RepID=A0A819VQI6_9BILA|nr:unnamed protein product [Rotaria socialis]CAF3198854.1 unnamed protein product [Rotaria socialis]CAF4113433.1 unnamed protein product [Rotaria socialis]CAF4306732.1 unnamed protein product [Rotaria socialis]